MIFTYVFTYGGMSQNYFLKKSMQDTQSYTCTEPETLFLKGKNTSDDLRLRLICEHSNIVLSKVFV